MQQTARQYISAGLRVVPASRMKKIPVQYGGEPATWRDIDHETAAARWDNVSTSQDAISLVCGAPSRNVEIIDFDHGGKQFGAWSASVPADLLSRLVIERSPSGGYHVGYRCDQIAGNLKLSMPPKPAEKGADWKAYIETRGEGGQCVVAPSPGYILQSPRSWSDIQTITADDRDTLISTARALTEYHPPAKQPAPARAPSDRPKRSTAAGTNPTDERPGDRYNREATESTTTALLTTAGWSVAGDGEACTRLTRPGKADGVSASVDSRGVFFCFTSSAGDFDGGTAYSPFSVYTILEHRGDYAAAARELAEIYGMTSSKRTDSRPATWDSAEPFGAAPDCYPRSDLGNARRLVHYHGHEIRFVPSIGWHVWTGNNWEIDTTGSVMRAAKTTVESIHHERDHCSRKDKSAELLKWAAASESAGKLDAMITVASTEAAIVARPEQLDAQPYSFNVSNGTLDLRTGQLRPHDPVDLLTHTSPVGFDAAATCPTFDRFMDRIFAGNRLLIDYVSSVLGHCLTADISLEHLWVCYGGGANGKSTLLAVVQYIMGRYASIAPDSLLTEGREEHPTELADLQGRRLVIASETENNARLKLQLVKRLTGEPTIKARRMRQDFYEFPRSHKLIMQTNNKPRVSEDSEAAWRRIKLIPFAVQIPESERDPLLAVKLKAEASGILNRLVAGCLAWQRNGLVEPSEVRAATSEYRAESDALSGYFNDCCILAVNSWASTNALYAAYTDWCRNNGEKSGSRREFTAVLAKRGFEPKQRNCGRGWMGLAIKPLFDTENDEVPTWDAV